MWRGTGFKKLDAHSILHRAIVRLACALGECGTGLIKRLASVLWTHGKSVAWSLANGATYTEEAGQLCTANK